MDRKSIIVLVVSLFLMVGWYWLVNRLYPPQPMPQQTNSVVSATNPVFPGTNSPMTLSGISTSGLSTGALVQSDTPEQLVVVENDDIRCTFTSHGGALKLAELKKYPESIACHSKNGFSTNKVATLNARAPIPAFVLLGSEALQGDGNFTLTKTDGGIRAEKTLPGGVRLVKEFQLGTNYLFTAVVRLQNASGQSVRLPRQEMVIGTATPLDLHDNTMTMGLQWYNGAKVELIGEAWFASRGGCVSREPRTEFLAGNSNVFWASVQNRFFTMIAIPPTNAPAPQLLARRIALSPSSAAEIAADPKAITNQFGLQTAFLFPELTLAPDQTVERRFEVFAGPKEYRTLDRLAAKFGNNVDQVMGFDVGFGGRFVGFFAKALLLSMNGLHTLKVPYSLAIIVITVIIKLVFWPLTQASTRSMKRMQALQPQVKAIQEKYKDDAMKMQKKMGELWREHKVNPAMGCLPMLIQIPIFIGFYTMLRSAIELRGASFLWICDLSQADTVFIIPGLGFIPFLGIPAVGFPMNPLPLIMVATQLWQTRLTPMSPGVDPMQQKMMQYMPVIFLFFMYNLSSGLTLYWTVSNLLTIAQMKVTKANDPAAAGGGRNSTPLKSVAPPPAPKKRSK